MSSNPDSSAIEDEKEKMIKSDGPPSVPLTQQGQFLSYVPNLEVPKEFIPNDFFVVTFVMQVICGIVSISTLLFSIPALICAMLSWMKIRKGIQFHREAKQFGKAALILDVIVLLWMISWGVFIVTYAAWEVYILNGYEADDSGCGGDPHIRTPFY